MQTNCLNCQEKLTGRSDKKFCTEACKNDFNNRASGARKRTAGTEFFSSMSKNREVLAGLFANGIREINAHDLECFGFNFKSITGVEVPKNGALKLVCNDFKLIPEGTIFKIVKQLSVRVRREN